MTTDIRNWLMIVEAQGAIRDMDVYGDDYKILKNPTKRELAIMARDYYQLGEDLKDEMDSDVAEDQHVRTLYDPDERTLYAWGALHNTHDYVASEILSLNTFDKGRVNYDPASRMSNYQSYSHMLPAWSLQL